MFTCATSFICLHSCLLKVVFVLAEKKLHLQTTKNNKFAGQLKLSMFLNAVLCLQCQLMKNGKVVVSVWENNREAGEDGATQVRRFVSARVSCEHI